MGQRLPLFFLHIDFLHSIYIAFTALLSNQNWKNVTTEPGEDLVQIFGFNETMIALTRLNGTKYYLNADLIVSVEGTPDTVITLTNEAKFIVRNRPEDVIQMIVQYQQLVHNPDIQVKRGE